MLDWHDWQSTPWGRLYYTLTHANLAHHLPERPLRILDVGGGNGGDTRYYAALGHQVTMLDYSPAMLEEARRLSAAAGVETRITFVEMDASRLAEPGIRLPVRPFDLALCHLMLEFTPQPKEILYDPVSYAQLEALELRLASEFPYSLLARFYQLIVRRPDPR